jgi:hypothetical protein
MARRFVLLVILAGALVVPAGAATIPIPTAGFVRVGICTGNGCYPGYELTGWVEFAGAVLLEDGTSHFGTFGFDFQAHEECGPAVCRYVFGKSPISKVGVTFTGLPVCEFGLCDVGLKRGRQVTGWCSGSLVPGGLLARFSCHLETPQGLTGDRKILATLVPDPYATACRFLCNGMGGPPGPDQYIGAYTQGDASLPV